jgi:hypothetical protein
MNITRGIISTPPRLIVYGKAGLGKTSFACGVEYPSTKAREDVLCLDYEGGTFNMDVHRVKGAETWKGSLELIIEASREKGPWKTLVLDTVDKLEDQATKAVCDEGKKQSLADFKYGDGFEALAAKWREMLWALEEARDNGRAVILVCHVQTKTIDDPTIGKYDRYIPALSKRCWGATHRWADAVLFANYEQGLHEGRAIQTGQRLLYTTEGTGFEAKNRYGLPPVMPLSWSGFEREMSLLGRTADAVRTEIRALAGPAGGELATKAEAHLKEAGDDVRKLCAVERALQKKLAEPTAPVTRN